MPKKIIDIEYDFIKNKISNVKLNPLSTTDRMSLSLTTNDKGFVSYDTTINKLYTWNGISWDTSSEGITSNIISDLTVGAIIAGQEINAPKNLQEFAELLLNTTFYPIFINPSITMSNSIGNNIVEVGASQILTLTVSYNFGEIRGALSTSFPHIWDANLKQNNRSGSVLNYVINNLNAGSNNFRIINGFIPINGYNTFSGYLNYSLGPQPLDSKGLNFSTPLSSGTSATVTTNFLAKYKQFFGNVTSFPLTSNSVRSLENNNFENVNTFNGFISSTKYVLAIPATKTLNNIITANFENITDSFNLSLVLTSVNDASGAPVNYKVYQFSSDSPLNLNITINLT